jgi:hypothetical protein
VLRRAMSGVHYRLEDVIFRVEWCVFYMFSVMCQDTDSHISANAKVCTSLQM